MPTKKLTKAEKLVQEQMLALLEWAADRPKPGIQSAPCRRHNARPNYSRLAA
jgi:hypothetical protein